MAQPNEPEHPEADAPETQECFECGAHIAPDQPHGVAVTEGVILCPECCEQRHPSSVRWNMPPWFEDLTGDEHHT